MGRKASNKPGALGKIVDDAMDALKPDNPRLKGTLNENYGRPDLDKHIDLIGSIQLVDAASESKDVLGSIFEYFFTQFANAERENGGQFYIPSWPCAASSRCSPLTKDAYTTPPAAPAACVTVFS